MNLRRELLLINFLKDLSYYILISYSKWRIKIKLVCCLALWFEFKWIIKYIIG